jgi:hypothetical protein
VPSEVCPSSVTSGLTPTGVAYVLLSHIPDLDGMIDFIGNEDIDGATFQQLTADCLAHFKVPIKLRGSILKLKTTVLSTGLHGQDMKQVFAVTSNLFHSLILFSLHGSLARVHLLLQEYGIQKFLLKLNSMNECTFSNNKDNRASRC